MVLVGFHGDHMHRPKFGGLSLYRIYVLLYFCLFFDTVGGGTLCFEPWLWLYSRCMHACVCTRGVCVRVTRR
jgi:hypothetical protein